MLSLRNGTAMAIILSIAFVVVAVAGRDQLPGFANDNGNSATSVASQPAATRDSASTSANSQIGQSESRGIDPAEPTQEYVWDGEVDQDEHDGDHHDDDDDFEHDGNGHGDEDDD